MTKKISELPAAPDYTVTDYLPIVDAETNATKKLYISQLVTASFGLSASFITLDTTSGIAPSSGMLRVPASTTDIDVVTWNKGGNFQLLRTNSTDATWKIGTSGSASGTVQGYTLNLDGWTSLTVSNAGVSAFQTAPSTGTTFITPVTASNGVSASFATFGTYPGKNSSNRTANSGLVRLPYYDLAEATIIQGMNSSTTELPILKQSQNQLTFGDDFYYGYYRGYVLTLNGTAYTSLTTNNIEGMRVDGSYIRQKLPTYVGSDAISITPPGDASLFVSGTQGLTQGNANRKIAVIGGDLHVSGTLYASAVTGSSGTGVGTYANRPSAGATGKRYLTTDGINEFVDTGTVWRPIIGGTLGWETPSSSSFTAINAGGRSTTTADDCGGIFMRMTNGASADDFRLLKKTAPSPPYTFTVHAVPVLTHQNYCGFGICFRQSTTGHIWFWGVIIYSNFQSFLARCETANNNGASPTYTYVTDLTYNGNAIAGVQQGPLAAASDRGVWLRIADDNTNRTYSWSPDGKHWQQLASHARTDQFTTDEIGLVIAQANSAGNAASGSVIFDSYELG